MPGANNGTTTVTYTAPDGIDYDDEHAVAAGGGRKMRPSAQSRSPFPKRNTGGLADTAELPIRRMRRWQVGTLNISDPDSSVSVSLLALEEPIDVRGGGNHLERRGQCRR